MIGQNLGSNHLSSDARRSVSFVKALCQEGLSIEDVEKSLGKADRDIGSGLHIWVYDLHDGTSIIVGGAGREAYVSQVAGARRGPGGLMREGRLIEAMYPKK